MDPPIILPHPLSWLTSPSCMPQALFIFQRQKMRPVSVSPSTAGRRVLSFPRLPWSPSKWSIQFPRFHRPPWFKTSTSFHLLAAVPNLKILPGSFVLDPLPHLPSFLANSGLLIHATVYPLVPTLQTLHPAVVAPYR
jgi:hypothetical protein